MRASLDITSKFASMPICEALGRLLFYLYGLRMRTSKSVNQCVTLYKREGGKTKTTQEHKSKAYFHIYFVKMTATRNTRNECEMSQDDLKVLLKTEQR
jgi:hypothetical protein